MVNPPREHRHRPSYAPSQRMCMNVYIWFGPNWESSSDKRIAGIA